MIRVLFLGLHGCGMSSIQQELSSSYGKSRIMPHDRGLLEVDLESRGTTFRTIDVSRQRNERRKWIHSFDDLPAYVYVVPLGDYDQCLEEDEKAFRMKEILDDFDAVSSMLLKKKKMVILCFSKDDLFRSKLHSCPISVVFPEYQGGPDNEEESRQYIIERFLLLAKKHQVECFTMVWSADYKSSCPHFMQLLERGVLRTSLERMGLAE